MKSRTNVHQELMRQQIIEEERNSQPTKFKPIPIKYSKPFPGKTVLIKNDNNSKNLIFAQQLNLNKRQRSASYTITDLKKEPFSPCVKSPMDYSLTELGNDDAFDLNQIEPTITDTSEISAQEILEQMKHNDDVQELSQSEAALLKASTSCPSNMAANGPFVLSSNSNQQTVLINIHNPHTNTNQIHLSKQPSSLASQASSGSNRTTPNPSGNVNSIGFSISEDQKLQLMRDRNKKDSHNRIERKRRDYINNQIQELGQLLPDRLFQATESKRNKGGILKNSVLYIQQLNEAIDFIPHFNKETQLAETTITALLTHIQKLHELINSNNSSILDNNNSTPLSLDEKSMGLQDWFSMHQHNSKILHKLSTLQSLWTNENTGTANTSQSSDLICGDDDVDINSNTNNNNSSSSNLTAFISSNIGNDNTNKLSIQTNCDEIKVKEEAISVENLLTAGVLQGTPQPTSSGGCSSSASGTPSGGVTNLGTSSGTSVINNRLVLGNTQSAASNSNSNQIRTTRLLIENSRQPQQHQQLDNNPVLSSMLIGGNTTSPNKPSHNQYHHSNSASNTTAGLSHSVPDNNLFRNTILAQSHGNEKYYLISTNKLRSFQQQQQQIHVASEQGATSIPTRLIPINSAATQFSLQSHGDPDDIVDESEDEEIYTRHQTVHHHRQHAHSFTYSGGDTLQPQYVIRQQDPSNNVMMGSVVQQQHHPDNTIQDDPMIDGLEFDDIPME